MRYYYTDNKYFYVGFTYDKRLVSEVKLFSGAGYNPENKEWYIPIQLTSLAPIKKWLSDNMFTEGVHYTPSKRVLELVEPTLWITANEVERACGELGLKRKLRHYQCEGVAYMINHGNCINGDDCGLGKTSAAIFTIELLNLFPVLVITPASVKFNWKKEWNAVNPDRSVGVIDRKTAANNDGEWYKDIVVINYDMLNNRNSEKLELKYKELTSRKWAACILDEIHFLKNSKAQRTKLVKKITKKIHYIYGLTGTLTQNAPIDIIQPYKIIRKFDETFGSETEFKFRYCNAKKTIFGFDCSGFSNLEELHEMLRMSGYIRRNKREVLNELPEMVEQIVETPITNRKEYFEAENDLLNYLQNVDTSKLDGAVNAPHLVMLQVLRELSVMGKIHFIKKYINEWLEANSSESLVVFGVHREPLQVLAAEFDAPCIQGGTSLVKRQEVVERFVNGEFRVLFANIQTIGTGVDGLQKKCSNLFYIELPDKSTDLEQATSRLERMGQKNSINVTYLLCPQTIDMEMYDTIKDKSLITGVVNKGERENELIARKFLSRHGKNQ